MVQMMGIYQVKEKLAEGGMGSVFLARAPDGTRVVLKVPLARDRESAIALADEARTGARLRHPAIIETLDFFIDNGNSVLVVAYVDGPSLYDLRLAGPLPPAAVAEIGVQLAGALLTIHTVTNEAGQPLNMLHRDVSPNNVLIDKDGHVRLIDLGLVRSSERWQQATSAGKVKGTLRYLGPEIFRGGDHTMATDVWALGLTLWEAAMARYAVAGDPTNSVRAALDGTVLARAPQEQVDAGLLEVVAAFVCPLERRVQNARAAEAILKRLRARHPGGRAALAQAVAVISAAALRGERTENLHVTRAGVRVSVTPHRGPGTVDIARAQIDGSAPGADGAPVFTTRMPLNQLPQRVAGDETVFVRRLEGPPTSEESSVWSARSPAHRPIPSALAAAPTEAAAPSPQASLPADAARTIQMPRFASAAPDATGDANTLLQVRPLSQMPVTAVDPGSPDPLDSPVAVNAPPTRQVTPAPFAPTENGGGNDMESAATVQMAAWRKRQTDQ